MQFTIHGSAVLEYLKYRMTEGNKPVRYIPTAQKLRMEAKAARKAARPEDQVNAERLANKFIALVTALPKEERAGFFLCCFYCGDDLTEVDGNLDHIYPRSLGGKRVVNSCKKCNSRKGDQTVEWFRKSYFKGGMFWAEGVIERLTCQAASSEGR